MEQITLLVKLSITPDKRVSWRHRVELLLKNVMSGDIHNDFVSVEEVQVDEPKVKKVAANRKVRN